MTDSKSDGPALPADFTLEDLTKDLSDAARDAVSDLILGWARYDSLVSSLTMAAFGLPLDHGPILLGTMDTATKIDRLKLLYDQYGMGRAAQSIANLRQHHNEHVGVRNTIAHATCAGCRTSAPEWIVFAPVKVVKGKLGHMLVEQIHISGMRNAAQFAVSIGDALMNMLDALSIRPSERPPEPPAFRPLSGPTPQKSGGTKRPRQSAAERRKEYMRRARERREARKT